METIQGYVDHIIYRNTENGYTVLVLVCQEEELTCVGIFSDIVEGENIEAKGIGMPFNAYGDRENPLTLTLKNCGIAFSEKTDCAIRSGNFALIDVESTVFENIDGALVKCYGDAGEIRAESVLGINRLCDVTDEPFVSKSI